MIKQINRELSFRAPVFYEECLDSTNAALKRMALQGAESGTVLIARTQTSGRGRQGRSFVSPEGGLYLSMLLCFDKPDDRLLSLTAVAAVAVSEALEEALGIKTLIKWPNDLELNGKKLCGILTEAVTCGSQLNIIAGIGINLNTATFPEEIKERACSVFSETGICCDIESLYPVVIKHLDRGFSALPEIPGDCLDLYRARCSTPGKHLSNGGTAVRIDSDFSLIIRMPDGSEQKKFFGEIMQLS